MKKLLKSKKGFTLIELIVVIAILGILAAIAVPRLIGFQDTAKAQANKQSANQIKSAVAMGIASGEIVLDDNTATYYFQVTGVGGTLAVPAGNFTATDFTSINGNTTPTNALMADVLEKYVSTLTLKDVNQGGAAVPQAIGVQIDHTSVSTAVGATATAPSSYDYTLAD